MSNSDSPSSKSSAKPIGMAGVVVAIGASLFVVFYSRNRTTTPDKQPTPAGTPSVTNPSTDAKAQQPKDAAPARPSGPYMPYGTRDVPTKAKGTIRLATYNIENLYDDKDDPANSWAEELSSTKSAAHRKAAADAIKAIDADVLALEEVESKEALEWFLKGDGLDTLYPYVVSLDSGDGRGIEQSVISKFPLSGETNWVHAPLKGTQPDMFSNGQKNPDAGKPMVLHRSPLAVDVTIPADVAGGKPYAFTMLVVHCKSGRDYNFMREAEAVKHVELVAELEKAKPDRNIVILGDFNARPVDASFQAYVSGGLTDAFGEVRPGDAKFQTHASNRIIDHMLMNKAMAHELTAVKAVYAMPMPEGGFSAPKPEGYASDHLPVFVDLKPVD